MRRALLLAVVVSLSACSAAGGGEVTSVSGGQAQIVLTSAEHRQLAGYYAAEAQRLSAEAVEHERMRRSYDGLSLAVNDGIWARHCAKRAAKLRQGAQASLALATLHAEQASGDNDQGREHVLD